MRVLQHCLVCAPSKCCCAWNLSIGKGICAQREYDCPVNGLQKRVAIAMQCAGKVSLALGRLGLVRKITTASIKQPDHWLPAGGTALHAINASVPDCQLLHRDVLVRSCPNFIEIPMPTATYSQAGAQLDVQKTPAVLNIFLWPLVWLGKMLPSEIPFVCSLASMALDEIGPGSQAIRSKPYREGGFGKPEPRPVAWPHAPTP